MLDINNQIMVAIRNGDENEANRIRDKLKKFLSSHEKPKKKVVKPRAGRGEDYYFDLRPGDCLDFTDGKKWYEHPGVNALAEAAEKMHFEIIANLACGGCGYHGTRGLIPFRLANVETHMSSNSKNHLVPGTAYFCPNCGLIETIGIDPKCGHQAHGHPILDADKNIIGHEFKCQLLPCVNPSQTTLDDHVQNLLDGLSEDEKATLKRLLLH